MSERLEHVSTMLVTRSAKMSQIPGPGREAEGTAYFIEWWIPFSFPGAGSCQTKLWVLNFEDSCSIALFSDMEKQSKKKSIEWHQGRKKAHFYKLDCGLAIFYFKWKAREMSKTCGVSQREILQTPCTSLTKSASFSQKKWKKKKKNDRGY